MSRCRLALTLLAVLAAQPLGVAGMVAEPWEMQPLEGAASEWAENADNDEGHPIEDSERERHRQRSMLGYFGAGTAWSGFGGSNSMDPSPLLDLNRFTFHQSVREAGSNQFAHWIILFCPTWFEPCQALVPSYRQLAVKWQDQLNGDLLMSEVRFAAVDCATEKVLCNAEGVGMNYPFVAHYREQKRVAIWRGSNYGTDRAMLKRFLEDELANVVTDPSVTESEAKSQDLRKFPTDVLVLFAFIAGNAWLISRFRPSTSQQSQTRASAGQPTAAHSQAATSTAAGAISMPSPSAASAKTLACRLPQEWADSRSSIEL